VVCGTVCSLLEEMLESQPVGMRAAYPITTTGGSEEKSNGWWNWPVFRIRLGGKHWHHVVRGTGRGPWWLACAVGRRPVWLGFGTVI